MKKTKIWLEILVLSMVFIIGCASISTSNSNIWLKYEIPPSSIKFTGDVFMQTKLSDGSICYVFQDNDLIPDAFFYYNILMQDFGWRRSGDDWIGNSYSRDYKRGSMYINPKRKVAIYFDPTDGIGIFRVRVENNTNSN